MKKVLTILFAIVLITLSFSVSECYKKDYSDYKNEDGYAEYISDSTAGYDDLPYYHTEDSISESISAREYYKENSRKVGDFIITDYMDGVCINKYCSYLTSDELIIPEEIDGKPVVKIGSYLDKEMDVLGAFAGNKDYTLKLPSTLKYIGKRTFLNYHRIIPEENRNDYTLVNSVEVSEDNPYYSSKYGSLYSKDYKKLLWVYTDALYIADNPDWTKTGYIVPEFVEVFEPSNGIYDLCSSVTFGKNVKEINTFIDKGESGCEPDPEVIPDVVIRGYKGTVAEEWAKEQYAEFEFIKD